MKGNFPFKFWCHRVLPLVYDDSISYYEFLCKIAKLVNDISKHNEEQDIAIANNAEHIDNVETKVDTLSDDVLGIAKRICATAFTTGTPYYIGDYCVYYPNATDENEMLMKGELYKSNDLQLTPSEFDNTKWDKVSVASELKLLFGMFDDLLKSLAGRYYPNTQYNKDDIVYYENEIWICKEATSASEFDRSKWDRFDLNMLVEMIDIVKHNIADEYEGYNGETITYPKYSVVWYNDKLYRADEEVVVDSESVLPPSENLKWNETKVSALFIMNNWTIESVANDLASTKLEIASGYIGYSGTPLFYAKDSIVWYNDRLYKALVDVTVDSESVLPPDSNNDWQRTTIAENLDNESGSVDMTPLFNIIAHTFNENDIYNSGKVVKKENANGEWVLYKCNDDGVTGSWDSTKWDEFYPNNIEISGMQLYDMTVGNQQRSAQNMSDIRELDTFFNSCIPMFLDKSVDASYPAQNFPKFSLCRTTNSPAPYAHVYYCISDTDNTSFDSNVWVEISNLYEWVKLITNNISRYSEVLTTPINTIIN
jgi:hypothetical protein